jgi:hypothetical protein
MRKVLCFAAVLEIATSIGLIAVPAFVVPLLIQGDDSTLMLLVARVLGITLLALGLACWPERPRTEGTIAAFRGMLSYNILIALFLVYVGAILRLGGPLLWPSVALHAIVALWLIWSFGPFRRQH